MSSSTNQSNERPGYSSSVKDDNGQFDSDVKERRHGTIQEAFEELQSGEVVGHMGFVPQRFLDEYLFRSTEDDTLRQSKKIEELAEKLIDRILVSVPSDANQSGIQMKLVQNVFEGAEIWMKKEKGEMSICFKTSTEKANEFLGNKVDELEKKMELQLNIPVNVSVEKVEADASENLQ